MRGTHQQHFDSTDEVLLVRWKDNKVVNMITNFDTVDPAISAYRYDRHLCFVAYHTAQSTKVDCTARALSVRDERAGWQFVCHRGVFGLCHDYGPSVPGRVHVIGL